MPETVWSPLTGALLILVLGLSAIALERQLLFANLSPTIYMQMAQPQQPTARFYDVVLGHMLGFGLGIIGVLLLSADNDPSVFIAKELTLPRLWASVLAVAVASSTASSNDV